MSKIFKPLNISDYQYWIDSILEESSDGLTDWENGFIDSISNWLSSGKNLTQSQAEKLEFLYTKYTK